MRYTTVLLDVDNTLLDFSASSFAALQKTFRHFGFAFDRPEWEIFSRINESLWEAFEQERIEKRFIYAERFRLYLEAQKLSADPVVMNAHYMPLLRQGSHLMPDCVAFLTELRKLGCEVCAVTNGETQTQVSRVSRAGIRGYFDHFFISEEIGYQKPSKAFFNAVFAALGEEKRKQAIIFGDSLTSDMQGGRNAGIATCLLRGRAQPDERCDYAVDSLMEFLDILN